MDDQRAHLRYVISLAPYGSRSEAFFRAASGDEEILGELRGGPRRRTTPRRRPTIRLWPWRRPDGPRKRSPCSGSLSRHFPTKTATA